VSSYIPGFKMVIKWRQQGSIWVTNTSDQ